MQGLMSGINLPDGYIHIKYLYCGQTVYIDLKTSLEKKCSSVHIYMVAVPKANLEQRM